MAIVAVLIALLTVQGTVTPRAAPSQSTAVVRGKVVDKQSGAPIARAVVSLRPARGQQVQQNLTNQQGAFEFTNLPGGEYELRASAGEFRATHVPAVMRGDPGGIGPLLQLADGEKREGIVLALPRALAISGRVTDEDGQPLANVEITRPTAGSGPGVMTRPRTTDDRGIFRVYGLPAGRHIVCATIQRGPSFDTKPQRQPQYVRTCYPSTTDPAQASEITLADQEVSNVEIRMQKHPSFVISGYVLSSTGGSPENAQIQIHRIERNSSYGSGTRLQAGGSFTISNVVAGTYEVSARVGVEPGMTTDERESEWTSVRLEISSADVEGLVLQLKKAVSLKGRVVFEDPPPASPTVPLQVMVAYSGMGASRPPTPPQRATVAEDGTFELRGLFGPVSLLLFGQGVPRGYTLKSVLYKGADIRHMAVEFDGDPAHQVELVLTNRTAEVSGVVLDDHGKPAAGAWILHFPADPARWKAFQGSPARTSPQGRYRIPPLVAGEYLLVAVSAEDQRSLTLPDDFDRLAAIAQRVPVLENERRTADLPLAAVPPRKEN